MKIGVIGFGNLGRSFIKGIINQNIVNKGDIYVCAKSEKSINYARTQAGVKASSDVNGTILNSDVVFFAIKENIFKLLAKDIDTELLKAKALISFMAGITIKQIQNLLETDIPIIRAMPSIAISNGDGIIGYTENKNSDFIVKNIFKKLGYAFPVNESDIEKVTAFSACGLGFAAYILNSFVEAGINLGFDNITSEKIVTQTFRNAIDMANYKDIISTVATKGGATEKGMSYMSCNNLSKIIDNAIQTSYKQVTQEDSITVDK